MSNFSRQELDRISILSVKHTGTNFIHQLLREFIGEVRSSHYNSLESFTTPEIIISPIRDPWRVYRTWYSRGRFGPEFFSEWNIFNEAWKTGKVHIVPIDTEDKQKHLDGLSDILNTKLSTDWTPVESMTRYNPPEIDLSKIYNLEVVKHFYGVF